MSLVFALDSSGKTASVCLLKNGTVLYEECLDKGLTHSETLLPLVQKALQETGLKPSGISLWAVSAGPGSFTGLRIGMALVKGLAFANSAKVAGVSTLKALAVASGLTGTVIPALDARRGEVYWGAFHMGKTLERLCPDKAEKLDEMRKTVESSKKPVFFVGDGAEMCYNAYNFVQAVKPVPNGQGHCTAKGVAMLAEKKGTGVLPQQLQPFYLRLPQAQALRNARLAQG